MPHLHIDYSTGLEAQADMGALCRKLAAAMAALKDASGKDVFPLQGTRVLAYPAAHSAGHPFVYLNLRIAPGRSRATLDAAGQALLDTVALHFDALASGLPFGLTLHIDEGAPVYEGRYRR